MTTVDIKLGAYVTICTVFLNHFARIVFKSSARIMGNGNPTASEYRLSNKVFFIRTGK